MKDKLSREHFTKLDLLGAFLLLSGSILVVFGFEEAGSKYPWNSLAVVASLVVGGLLMVAFFIYEKYVARPGSVKEPMLPFRLLSSRSFVGLTV